MNLLINPACMTFRSNTPPPLALLYIAAAEGKTIIHDEAIKPKMDLKKVCPRIVGVPVYTKNRHASLDRLREAKASGAITVAGGCHVSIMTDQMVKRYGSFIDYFVVGDGELAWKAICAGEDVPQVVKMRVENLDDLPLPAWDSIDWQDYPAIRKAVRVSILLGRGCTGRCTFCSAWWVNGRPRVHGLEWMGKHLTLLWEMGVRHLVFWDDSLTMDKQRMVDLCDVLDKFDFYWTGTARADEMNEALAMRMAEAGCYMLAFGIESGSPTILARMGKEARLEDALSARAACREAGIRFSALMIDGFPGSTAETERETAAFKKELSPDAWGSVGHTMVFPGTALYQECKRAGLVDDSFWLGKMPYYKYVGGL